MPWRLRKAPKRDLYWVIGQDGSHMSKDPLPKARAEAQIRALYASERQRGKILKGGAMNPSVLTNMLKFWFGILQRRADGSIYRKIPSKANLTEFFTHLLHHIDVEHSEGRYSDSRHEKLKRRVLRIRDDAIRKYDAKDGKDLKFIQKILKLNGLFPPDAPPIVEEIEDEKEAVAPEAVAEVAPEAVEGAEEEEEEAEEAEEAEEGTPTSPTSPRHTFSPTPEELAYYEEELKKRTLTPYEHGRYIKLRKQYRGYGHLEGAGVWDYFTEKAKQLYDESKEYYTKSLPGKISKATRTISEAFTPDTYAPSTRAFLNKEGRGTIQKMDVIRTPVAKALETFFSLLTLGKYDQAKRDLSYDKMFHLAVYIQYVLPDGQMKQAVLHKVEKVEYTNELNRAFKPETERMNVKLPIPRPTIHEIVKTTKAALGKNYFAYSAFKNNCQDFILTMLNSNGLLTPELKAFLYQPVAELIQKQPDYTEDVALTLTNLGGIWNRVVEGYGKPSKSLAKLLTPLNPLKAQLAKVGISPSAYLTEARRRATKFGYPSKLLGFSDDTEHKLQIPDREGRVVRFGRVSYGDHLLYSYLEKEGKVPSGTAETKQKTFQKSHSQIKGDWKKNDFSPNNLALRILW